MVASSHAIQEMSDELEIESELDDDDDSFDEPFTLTTPGHVNGIKISNLFKFNYFRSYFKTSVHFEQD